MKERMNRACGGSKTAPPRSKTDDRVWWNLYTVIFAAIIQFGMPEANGTRGIFVSRGHAQRF